MNAADRSVARLDDALRRRFSFLEMAPDERVLAAWLGATVERSFGERVRELFARLNERLLRDLGAHARVGHSYFMVPGLDEGRLRMVWQHHIRPLLDDHFASQPGRSEGYDIDALLGAGPRGRKREPAPF